MRLNDLLEVRASDDSIPGLMPEFVVSVYWSLPQFKGLEAGESTPLGPLGKGWEPKDLNIISNVDVPAWAETAALWEAVVGNTSWPGRGSLTSPSAPLSFCGFTSPLEQSLSWKWSLHPDSVIQPAWSPLPQLQGLLSAKPWGSPGSSEDISGQTRPHLA